MLSAGAPGTDTGSRRGEKRARSGGLKPPGSDTKYWVAQIRKTGRTHPSRRRRRRKHTGQRGCRREAAAWDPASANSCKAWRRRNPRMPGRLHYPGRNLAMESDAGSQASHALSRREAAKPAVPSVSAASQDRLAPAHRFHAGGRRWGGGSRSRHHAGKPRYLARNGVPYGAKATFTESMTPDPGARAARRQRRSHDPITSTDPTGTACTQNKRTPPAGTRSRATQGRYGDH